MLDANQCWDVPRGDPADGGARAASTRTGSRSRRAPTTCSATRRSRGRSRRSAWRPARTCQNRVVFKQLLQARAIAFCQVDACRIGGVNEVLAVLLLAAKFGVPVCPHARRGRASASTCSTSRSSTTSRRRVGRRGGSASTSTTCTSTSSTRASCAAPATRARGAGDEHRDEARVARQLRVPRRRRLARLSATRELVSVEGLGLHCDVVPARSEPDSGRLSRRRGRGSARAGGRRTRRFLVARPPSAMASKNERCCTYSQRPTPPPCGQTGTPNFAAIRAPRGPRRHRPCGRRRPGRSAWPGPGGAA